MQKEVDELLSKGASEPFTTHTQSKMNQITVCTYLLLKCLLSDRCGNLLSKVIMLFLFIIWMFISLFLLLSFIFFFYISYEKYTLQVEAFAQEGMIFLFSLLVCLELHSKFCKSELCPTQQFCFLRLFRVEWICLYLSKLLRYGRWLIPC